MTAACSLFGSSPDVFTVCIAEWTCGDVFRYSQSKFWLNEVYDDHECRSVGKDTKLTNNTTSKKVLADYLEMHKMCVWKYNMNNKDKWNIDERWINGCMSFGFTVGAYWAELVRFHPPQRHQQGEGTASVVRVVPSTTPHWCCKWVCCHVRFEKQLKWTLEPKRESTLELTKIKINEKWHHMPSLQMLSFCVQLGFRYRWMPPSGRLSWVLEPGEPSSAGWNTVGWRGSMRTNTLCPVLPKRKVGSDWSPGCPTPSQHV